MMNPFILGLVGPTAAGKTEFAFALRKTFPVEVVSADSMQIYKGLNIGTAKPSARDRKRLVHHVMDHVRPSAHYSVYAYRRDALNAIKDIHRRGKMPIIVGGSGLYLRALIDGLTQYPKVDASLRRKLERTLVRNGLGPLVKRLSALDSAGAARIDLKNPRRVIRALELAITRRSQNNKAERILPSLEAQGYRTALFGLSMDRDVLYRRVEERIDLMFKKGWITEARKLSTQRKGRTVKQAIGYGVLWASPLMRASNLRSREMRAERARVTAEIKQLTRHLVKKQCTWFRREGRIRWLDVTGPADRKKALGEITRTLKAGYAY